MNVRLQAIITELVFEHALRVRMKAGTNEGPESSAANTAIATPASQAGDEESTSDAGDGDTVTEQSATSSTTIQPSSSSSSKGKGKAQSGSPPSGETEAPKAMEKNIIGRINNLVSSDLSSLDNCSMYFVYARTCCTVA